MSELYCRGHRTSGVRLTEVLTASQDGDPIFKFVGTRRTRAIIRAKPLEVGKTYKDGHGQNVRIICTDRKDFDGYCIVGLIIGNNGKEGYCHYKLDGTYCEYSLRTLTPETETITESYLEEIPNE